MNDKNLNQVKKLRVMPFLKNGMRVEFIHDGRFGQITGGNYSGNINVKFDGDNFSKNCHPCYKMRYYDNNGNIIKEYNLNGKFTGTINELKVKE